MKRKVQIFSIILSFFLFFYSVWNCTLNVFAFPKFDWSDMSWKEASWEEAEGEIMSVLGYVSTSLSAITDGNFFQFMTNYYDFKSLWDESGWLKDQIAVDSNDNTITFSEDLTAYMKQALIEYAEETNGFKLYPTIDYDLVPASEFKSSYDYKTFRNLISESGCIVLNTGYFSGRTSGLYFGRPFHDIKVPVSLVAGTKYSDGVIVDARFYGTNTWVWYRTNPVKRFATQYTDSDGYSAFRIFTSWEEGEIIPDQTATNISSGLLDIRGLYPTGGVYGNTFFSDDGRKLKVFNSLDALKNYTVGTRSVYFGSGFYDDPGEIQVSFDDLEKYIDGKYDDFFDDLKDLIGDNEDSLTEEDLEKLVDKILDKMDDINGDNKPGDNTGDKDGISGILEGITSTISGYYDAVLMYLEGILTDLDYIVMEMQDMTEEEASTKTDSVLTELKDTFSDVGDVMTKKFPFCIPWDMKRLFVTLNGGKDYSGGEAAMLLSDDGIEGYAEYYALTTLENPELPTFKGYTGSGKLVDVIIYSSPSSRASPSPDDGIMTLATTGAGDDSSGGGASRPDAGGAYWSESGAPVFHIPFVLNSIGLNSALVIDMSPFDGVSDISRTLFLLIFIYQLILLSIRITEFLEGFIG